MINYVKKIEDKERNFLTQIEFAEILGVGKTALGLWETDKFEPAIKIKLAYSLILFDSL